MTSHQVMLALLLEVEPIVRKAYDNCEATASTLLRLQLAIQRTDKLLRDVAKLGGEKVA